MPNPRSELRAGIGALFIVVGVLLIVVFGLRPTAGLAENTEPGGAREALWNAATAAGALWAFAGAAQIAAARRRGVRALASWACCLAILAGVALATWAVVGF